jgi:hypothetical protein
LITQTPDLVPLEQLADPPESELSAQLHRIDATFACHLSQIDVGLAHGLRQTGPYMVFAYKQAVAHLKAGRLLS